MVTMSRKKWIAKYVGKVDTRRTKALKKRKGKASKGHSHKMKYSGVKVIKSGTDTTGVIMGGRVYALKGKHDRAKTSGSQVWESVTGIFGGLF